jgi:hypothetical protein
MFTIAITTSAFHRPREGPEIVSEAAVMQRTPSFAWHRNCNIGAR